MIWGSRPWALCLALRSAGSLLENSLPLPLPPTLGLSHALFLSKMNKSFKKVKNKTTFYWRKGNRNLICVGLCSQATWTSGKTEQLGLMGGCRDCSLMVNQNPRSSIVTRRCDLSSSTPLLTWFSYSCLLLLLLIPADQFICRANFQRGEWKWLSNYQAA